MPLSKSQTQSWIVKMKMLASEFLLPRDHMISMDIPDVAPKLAENLRVTTLLHKNMMRRVIMAHLAPNLSAVTPRMTTSPHRKQLWMISAMPACRACHMRKYVEY